MRNKALLAIVFILIIAATGFIFLSKPTIETEKTISDHPEEMNIEMPKTDIPTEMTPQEFDEKKATEVQEEIMKQETMMQEKMQGKKTFNIDAKNYSFSIKEIRVKKGDVVKIILKNTEGFHNWAVDEFNAQTAKINVNQSAEVEFTADKTGTFEYYCGVGNHRQLGMMGKLIVE